MNQDGPSLIIEAPPPPPQGPQIATDVNVFTYEKLILSIAIPCCTYVSSVTYYPLFFLVVHMYPVWWGLHDTLVPLDSTYASPGPPKDGNKIMKNQITVKQESFGGYYIWGFFKYDNLAKN